MGDELVPESPPQPARPSPVVVPYGVLLVFLIAAIIALILDPLVMERRRLPHGVAVLAVYIGSFAALVRETAIYLRRHVVLQPWPSGPGNVGG